MECRNMTKNNNLQETFYQQVQEKSVGVTLFLMNGYQLRGQITGQDAFMVWLTTEGKQQLIYKHAISTIIPEVPVALD